MKRGFRYRFVAIIFSVMCIAGILSACVAGALLNRRFHYTVRASQLSIAESMIELSKKSTLTTDEIIKLYARDMYTVRRTSTPFTGDIQFRPAPFFSRAETFVRIQGDGVRISLSPGKMLSILFFFTILLTSGTAVLAGTEALKRDFVNDVSHEFRTPLSSIHGFAVLLSDPSLPEAERLEYSRIIAAESKRLATIASDILNLSKLENQTIVTDHTWFSLDEEIRQTVLMVEPSLSAKKLSIQVDLPPLRFFGNAGMLRPVWINLLSNAVKFTPEGGTISIRLIDAEDEVIVRIKDSGIGIDDDAIAHIFEKFYQADASHANEGAGLGLPLARRIVTLCGGEIAAKSEPGQGSSFSVKLPRV